MGQFIGKLFRHPLRFSAGFARKRLNRVRTLLAQQRKAAVQRALSEAGARPRAEFVCWIDDRPWRASGTVADLYCRTFLERHAIVSRGGGNCRSLGVFANHDVHFSLPMGYLIDALNGMQVEGIKLCIIGVPSLWIAQVLNRFNSSGWFTICICDEDWSLAPGRGLGDSGSMAIASYVLNNCDIAYCRSAELFDEVVALAPNLRVELWPEVACGGAVTASQGAEQLLRVASSYAARVSSPLDLLSRLE